MHFLIRSKSYLYPSDANNYVNHMSITTILECSECGITGDEKYVAKCYFCGRPICTSCASWVPAKQETIYGTYHTVNRICKQCRPKV